MNNKTKTILYIVLIVLLIIGATFAYNNLKESNQDLANPLVEQGKQEVKVENEAATMELEAGDKEDGKTNDQETTEGKDKSNETEEAETKEEPEKISAPDFLLKDMDGNEVNFLDYVGKPIVLNFWASWCPPCKAEMPDFEEMYKEVGDDITFMMVDLVDQEGGRETESDGRKFIEEEGFTFPVYFDINQEAAITYGITSIPTTIFIDSEGNIVANAKGAINKDILIQGIGLIQNDVEVE